MATTSEKKSVLICDDDAAIRSSLGLVLGRAGYEVAVAATPAAAIDHVRNRRPALILMDMNYSSDTSGEEGLTLLKQVKVFHPDVPVILITAWGSISLAVRGMQSGAFDFITKPWNNHMLLKAIDTAISLGDQKAKQQPGMKGQADPATIKHASNQPIVGKSAMLQQVFQSIARIAPTNAPVLITGESGTGKELIAEAIHHNSLRSKAPFVKVNLGGISTSLFESEMFGHKKGAFTDAHYDRTGRFEMADKGTIFLDEIGELDATCQVKLLRVLQDQTFEALGDSKQKRVDVRVVSATNRNLATMVAEGTFREDLYYRINLISIRMPALRERAEDIPVLAQHFADRLSAINNTEKVRFLQPALDYLKRLPYPGNIRELKNLVERTILVSGKAVITAEDITAQHQEVPAQQDLSGSIYPLDVVERNMVEKAMELYGGNLSKVATALGLTRQALYRRMEKYGIGER